MSSYYQDLDRAGGYDYQLYKLPSLGGKTFRGPRIDTSLPYLAFVGAAQTFGRFATMPFPSLLGGQLGIGALNLGVGAAGPRHFDRPEYIEVINGAEVAIIQVLSARSASNSLFDNSETGCMVGRLRSDQSIIRADEFFSRLARSSTPSDVESIVAETRADYMTSFTRLLKSIKVPKILFWLSTRHPKYKAIFSDSLRGFFAAYPQLVNQEMIQELAGFCDDYVECASADGLPQSLWASDRSIDGAVMKDGILQNNYYPSPAMHVAASDALIESCRRLLGKHKKASTQPARRFVIVAAPRTGTNLLVGLLNGYPDCCVGSEIFNRDNIDAGIVPWPGLHEDDLQTLLTARKEKPVAFLEALYRRAASRGFRAIGFKLLYIQGYSQKEVLEHLLADKTIGVVHLKRRNLLRRLVSERQALAVGKWATNVGATVRRQPAVELSMNDILASFQKIETDEENFDRMFSNHRVLQLAYEDLAQDPLSAVERVADFLQLEKPSQPITVKHVKTGYEKLADGIVHYQNLQTKMRRWTALFED